LNAEPNIKQVNLVLRRIKDNYQYKESLFPKNDALEACWLEDFWVRIVLDNRLDLTLYDTKSWMIGTDIPYSSLCPIG
jgi:hypothetical protein